MSRLEILATDESPHVLFDPTRGMLLLEGKSLPEDITEFYNPLEQAVKEYMDNPRKVTTININLVYLNSSSTKRILEILAKFEKLYKEGYSISLNWYYREHDEDMMEEGEEFARLIDLPVSIIQVSD